MFFAAVSVFSCLTFGGWIDALTAGEGPGVQRVHPFDLKDVRLLDGPSSFWLLKSRPI
jgi:hypothetical protein